MLIGAQSHAGYHWVSRLVPVVVVAFVSSSTQATPEALLQRVPLEEHSYVQERLEANALVSDLPEPIVTWQFIRRYGQEVEGLSVKDGRLLSELADMDRDQIGKDASWPIIGTMCLKYEAKQLDVIGAASMFDMARRAQNEAFDRAVRRILDQLSPAGKETLAKGQADVSVVARQRRAQDWEGMARDAPQFTGMVMARACRRFASMSNGTVDGVQPAVIKEVVKLSGSGKSTSTQDTRSSVDSAPSAPSGQIHVRMGGRDRSATESSNGKSQEQRK